MADVAKEAGVALGTVSKVVRGIPVGESYRIAVEDAIKKLDYQVNSYAQGMKLGRTNTVAVLVPNTVNLYFASLVSSLNKELTKRHLRMMLFCTDYDRKQEQESVNMAAQNEVDGIISLAYSPNLKLPKGTPYVAIDRVVGPDVPCVASDNFAGGQMAAEKLADLGCHHVAFLRVGSSLSNEPNKRRSGFENGCLSRNLTYEMKILGDDPDFGEFEQFLRDHIENGKCSIDGIFCVTDFLAWRIQIMLKSMGISVPEDVQLIGFDGVRNFGYGDYLCSTIVQPVEAIAKTSVSVLLQDDPAFKTPLILLPVSYAYGGTTKDRPEGGDPS